MGIKIENITKTYNDEIVLNDITYEFKKNEVTVIVGESGSGKTTLLNIISLFLESDAGEVFFENENVSLLPKKTRQKFIRNNIGYVYQDIRIFEEATVYENLKMGLLFSDVSKKKYEVKILEMIELLGLTGKENIKAGLLSGGQKQRVAIGRALISGKKYIFADEPTGALDRINTQKILELLKKINQELGATIVIITHSQRVSGFFTNTIELVGGEIVEK